MTSARDVLQAVKEAEAVRDLSPVLWVRAVKRGLNIHELRSALAAWRADVSTPLLFSGNGPFWDAERPKRRKRNRAARQARKANR